MTQKEAEAMSKKLFGPTVTAERLPVGTCLVVTSEGTVLGVGSSWRDALKCATLPLLKELHAKPPAQP